MNDAPKPKAQEYQEGWDELQREYEAANAKLKEQMQREREVGRYESMAEAMVRELKRKMETVPLDDIPGLTQERLLAEGESADYAARAKYEGKKTAECQAEVNRLINASKMYAQNYGALLRDYEREQRALSGNLRPGDVEVSPSEAGIFVFRHR